jgi:hypothetical protein
MHLPSRCLHGVRRADATVGQDSPRPADRRHRLLLGEYAIRSIQVRGYDRPTWTAQPDAARGAELHLTVLADQTGPPWSQRVDGNPHSDRIFLGVEAIEVDASTLGS